ncbi:MAG: hypothetical protein OXO49_03140 [Gammaproteobacteria bacterium]|nr:hypothetical protein [Gammaproteobacteria bacterium]MDE0251974.1 hypothetical protein [Gammaproteobacteria bacterium]MDE0402918.1 hypothetical protein [Gammaproteobacteria bacterium]
MIQHQLRRRFATRAEARMKIIEFIEGSYSFERKQLVLGFQLLAEFEQARTKLKVKVETCSNESKLGALTEIGTTL